MLDLHHVIMKLTLFSSWFLVQSVLLSASIILVDLVM